MQDQQNSAEDEIERVKFIESIKERNSQVKKIFKNGQMVNGCNLTYDSVFGINNKQIYGQLQIVGENYILFSASNMIVIKDLITKQYQFIAKENRLRNVTAIYAGMKKKGSILIAVGESSVQNDERHATVAVTQNDKQKWNILTTGVKGTIKQIELNIEKNFCCVLLYPQNSNLPIIIFFNYKKDKLLASMQIKSKVVQLTNFKFSLHPQKANNLILTGSNYFKIIELFTQEKILKESHTQLIPLKIEKENKFLDHCWINTLNVPTLVALAAGNKIFVLQNDILKVSAKEIDVGNMNITETPVFQQFNDEEIDDAVAMHNVYDDIAQEKRPSKDFQGGGGLSGEKEGNKQNKHVLNQSPVEFHCITPTKRGFVLGGSRGFICINDIEKNNHIVSTQCFEMKFANNEDHKVIFVSSSQNDSNISIVSVAPDQSLSYHILNTYQLDTEVSPIQPFFHCGVHQKKVNCLSASVTKQIFASCSEDNTVKIWNYYMNDHYEKKGIISKEFKEEPLSVSLHPLGMFIAIGFMSGFHIYSILSQSLQILKEINLPSSNLLKYSNGGHYLVVNEKNTILIYDTIQYEEIAQLEGHQATIRDFSISDDDLYIVSTCVGGYVYCWNLLQPKSTSIFHHQEESIYNKIAYDTVSLKSNLDIEKENKFLFVGCSNSKYLRIQTQNCQQLVAEFPVIDVYITCLVISPKLQCIFLGTNKGKIRISLWPLYDQSFEYEQLNPNSDKVCFKTPEFIEVPVHQSPITALCLSYDNQFLYTGDEEGTIFMLRIENIYQEGQLIDLKKNSAIKFEEKQRIEQISNDLFFSQMAKVINKNEIKKNLSFEVIKLEHFKKNEQIKIDRQYKLRVEALNQEFDSTMKGDENMRNTFVTKSEEEYAKLLKQVQEEQENFHIELDKLKQQQNQKIEYEEQRNMELEMEIEKLRQQHKQNLLDLNQMHKDELKKLKIDFYDRCKKVQLKYSNVVDNAKNYGQGFIKKLELQEEQFERDIDNAVQVLKEDIAKVQQNNEKLEKENQELIKEYELLKQDDEKLQQDFEEMFKNHNQIRYQNLKNDEDILKMQHQLLERLQVIDSKEETCKAAKDEQINLENFRYMLDQKIKTLQDDKTLLLQKINGKESSLKENFNELIKLSNDNEEKYKKVKNLNAELNVLENSIKKAEVEIFFNCNKLTSFQNNLGSIMKSKYSVATIAKKLYDMLEKSQNNEELEKYTQKKVISNEDIQEIIKMKQEKPNEINDELLKQGRWLTQKLSLIKDTSARLKEIKNHNIQTILKQNTKLIQECNMLRAENEKYRSEMKQVEKELADAIRRRQKLRNYHQQQNQTQQPNQMNKLIQKYDFNTQKLQEQQERLGQIKGQIDEILVKQQDDSRLPPIKHQKFLNQQEDINQNVVHEEELEQDMELEKSPRSQIQQKEEIEKDINMQEQQVQDLLNSKSEI